MDEKNEVLQETVEVVEETVEVVEAPVEVAESVEKSATAAKGSGLLETEEFKKTNKHIWIVDVIAIIILLLCMIFMVKVLPMMMGGAHDALGNPISVAAFQVQTLASTLL